MGTEFQVVKMKKSWRWITVAADSNIMFLTPMPCTLKNGYTSQCCYVYFTTIKNHF